MKLTKIIFITFLLSALTTIDFSCKKDLLKEVSITPGTFTDPRDGKTYKTTTIGTYTWLAENLDYATDSSFYYNNDTVNKVYGRLYTWNAAQVALPAGWHLPTYSELKFLYDNLGGDNAGNQLVETGKVHWTSSSTDATNYSQLTILPGGDFMHNSNQFEYLGSLASFWDSQHTSWGIEGNYSSSYFYYANNITYQYEIVPPGDMLTIRCVRNY